MTAAIASAYPVSVADTAPVAEAAPIHIAAHNIAVEFKLNGRRQRVLQDINLSVPKGSFVALIGPSGCGKSTLLKVLAGLVQPVEGTVSVAGLAPQGREAPHDRPRVPGRDSAAMEKRGRTPPSC